MEKHNTVHAIFASGAKTAEIIDDVWQYDFGQTLQIEGLSLPPTIEVHYANKGRDTAIPQVGVTKDGITTAPIPNEILSEKGAFTAYIFVTDGKSGETCYTITGYINKRPALKEFDTPEEQEILHAAVGAVNAAAERAESAETKATEAASQASEDAKQTAADRAEVERLVESVSGIGEQVTKVENLTKQAQTSATNAALSEQAAKTAETNAQTAQAGAETAEGNAELAEQRTKASEQAVEKAKQLVAQMGQEVLDNKNHVDQTVQAFDQTAQQAVADVNNAGQTQTERVQSAGNTAVESVKTAQTAATKAIETTKTEAVKAVQTEGTTQTGNVSAEGEKQVQAVQAAAQEIVADREQIKKNKADIAEIKEEMDNLSPAIVDTATGEAIVVEDSSGNKFRGLSIYGKSEQLQTTGAQLFDFENAMQKKIENWTSTNILSAQNTNDISVDWKCLKGTAQGYIAIVSPFEFEAQKTVYLNINKVNAQRLLVYDTTGVTKHDLFTNSYTPTESFSGYIGIGIDKGRNVNGALICGYTSGFSATEPYTGGKPSPSVEYPQEIANAGDGGSIIAEIGNDGYVEKGMRFAGNKKIPLKKGSYLCLKNNNVVNAMNAYVVDDGDLISKLTNDSSDALYNYCQNELRITNQTLSGNIIKSNARLSQIWRNGLIYKIENDGLYLYYSCNSPVHDSDDCYVWFLDSIGSMERPYKSKTITLPTPNSLPGIPVSTGGNYTDSNGQQWVCDEIDLRRGKYVQRVGVVNDKISNLNLATSNANSNGSTLFLIADVITKHGSSLMCNMLRNGDTMKEDQTISSNRGNGFKIYFTYYKASNIDELKTYIGENEIYILYELPDPIEHDLPPEIIEAYKQLHTNYPVTTVLNDSGAGMKVEYVADTKNYTDNKIAESVKNQMQNLTNLLSLMPMETQAAMIENDVNRILESEVTK